MAISMLAQFTLKLVVLRRSKKIYHHQRHVPFVTCHVNVSHMIILVLVPHLYLCICVFVYLFICVFVYLCICVFVYLCICVFVYLCVIMTHVLPVFVFIFLIGQCLAGI